VTIFELIKKRRTIRRFKQNSIPIDVLTSIVDTARKAPSAANKQPLEFILVNDTNLLPPLFSHTRWAAYLPKEDGPPPGGQRPVAYVVVLVNKAQTLEKWTAHDSGAAIENMILAALSKGIGTCWIGSLNRESISELLNIPKEYNVDSVLALGYPDEQPQEVVFTDSVKYYKKNGTLFVPKKTFDETFHHNKF
jgi:nitroreductase